MPVSAELVGLLNVSPALSVQRNDLVYQRQLFILKFLLDVFLYGIRVLPDKLHIKHISSSLLIYIHFEFLTIQNRFPQLQIPLSGSSDAVRRGIGQQLCQSLITDLL